MHRHHVSAPTSPVHARPGRLVAGCPRWLLVAAGGLVAVGLLLDVGRADAGHRPDETLHVCAHDSNGQLRVDDDCKSAEQGHVLATEDGLRAAEERITALEADNAALQSRVEELEGRVDELEATLAGVRRTTDDGRDTLRFEAMNLQLVNGEGATDTTNGLGNLIVGYNGERAGTERSGSHYLVVGDEHDWSSYGGLLAGRFNIAEAPGASVIGGHLNHARGQYATVTAGTHNVAAGWSSSVTGGEWNAAGGDSASVTGGTENDATGGSASVTGGFFNEASGGDASVTGGAFNTASGQVGSVDGGEKNTASGEAASVSGGDSNTAQGDRSSILGGSDETVSDNAACHPAC